MPRGRRQCHSCLCRCCPAKGKEKCTIAYREARQWHETNPKRAAETDTPGIVVAELVLAPLVVDLEIVEGDPLVVVAARPVVQRVEADERGIAKWVCNILVGNLSNSIVGVEDVGHELLCRTLYTIGDCERVSE